MRAWIELGPERAAIYERLLPDVRHVGWTMGYAIGQHGSMRRDMDLIAVPWIDAAAPAEMLVRAVNEAVGGDPLYLQYPPNTRPHGRRCWSLHLKLCPHLYIDLSVMPRASG